MKTSAMNLIGRGMSPVATKNFFKRSRDEFRGVFTALVTPFFKGEIDQDSFSAVVEQQLAGGVRGFVVNGTTGESPTLHSEEVEQLLRAGREVAKSKGLNPVFVVGTGTNSTEKTVEATLRAQELGVDAALVVVPYYNKPNELGLVRHFEKLAQVVKIPLILYNVPSRTGVSLSVDTVAALSVHPQIIGLKEASGNLSLVKAFRDRCGDEFILLSGDDQTSLQFVYIGGDGVISVCSHVLPEQMVSWMRRVFEKDISAIVEFAKYRHLVQTLYLDSNPIPVKMALYLMNLIQSAELRLPLTELSEEKSLVVRAALREVGLL